MNDKIYPSLPERATKDFYEMITPLEWWELECTCKYIEGVWTECKSCKLWTEERYKDIIPALEGEL